jgi:hypothetical protein
MRDFYKFGLLCRGRVKAGLRFSVGVSGLALALGLGMPRVADAAVCFLPDCTEKPIGSADPNGRICRSGGYLPYGELTCSEFSYVEYCPEDASYIKCNDKKWCEDNGYTVLPEDCVVPDYAEGQCPNGLELYRECKTDYARACGEEDEDYVSECQEGWKLDEKELCVYSPLYGKCCNECLDYPYEAGKIPSGYHEGESCLSCEGLRYQKEINDCAGDGFVQCSKGGKTGTEVCLSGNDKWYKECCSECDGYPYTYSEIPLGYLAGESCQSCNGTKYKLKSGVCALRYKWENGACVPDCRQSCTIGNILYSDHTCNTCIIEGKTPIGVIAYENETARLAIQLQSTSQTWGRNNYDIKFLPNGYNNTPSGKENTVNWTYEQAQTTFGAARYCTQYTTPGTIAQQWFLPSTTEFISIYKNRSLVESGLKETVGTGSLWGDFWSSNESDANYAYYLRWGSDVSTNKKDKTNSTRCVLPLEDNGNGTATVCSTEYVSVCRVGNDTHIIGGIGTSCGGLFKECQCEDGYIWDKTSCEKPCDNMCYPGSFLYSDYSCCSTRLKSKTPIGIVTYADGNARLAMSLAQKDNGLSWLPYELELYRIYKYPDNPEITDFDGRANSQVWLDYFGYLKDIENYRFGYCYNYTTEGTSKGQWYVPATGELYTACTNRTVVDAALRLAGGNLLSSGGYYSHGTSSQISYGKFTTVSFSISDMTCGSIHETSNYYTGSNKIRCFLPFEFENNQAKICDIEYKYQCNVSDDSHIQGSIGESCGGMYKSCSCADGYIWENGACQEACDNVCTEGSILYSDHSCCSQRVEGKTPIGVVSYVDGNKRLALYLVDRAGGSWSPHFGLVNPSGTTSTNIFEDRIYTQNWISFWGENASGSPLSCYKTQTAGTSPNQWYLPTSSKLSTSINTNKVKVNDGLTKAGSKSLSEWSYNSITESGEQRYVLVSNSSGGSSSSTLKTSRFESGGWARYGVCALPFEYNGTKAQICDGEYAYTCAVNGKIIGGKGNTCQNLYRECLCADGYEWKRGACVSVKCPQSNCFPGSIFYTDLTCSSGCKIADKDVIGVVGHNDGSTKLILSLKEAKLPWAEQDPNGYNYKFEDVEGIPNLDSDAAKTDFNGKSNTEAWLMHYADSEDRLNYAPGYCYNYAPSTAPGTKGMWYLPSAGELAIIIGKDNSVAVNRGLLIAGGTGIADQSHSTSTEYTIGQIQFVSAYSGGISAGNSNEFTGNKQWIYPVRCTIKY